MAKRDYYAVLGVSKSATQDEIRKAYRKLARQYHPDVNKSPDAQARFTEVQAAYDVLGDEQKRRQYDQYGDAGEAGPSGFRPGARGTYTWTNVGGGGGPAPDIDFDDLGSMFETFFGARGAGAGFGSARAGSRRPRAQRQPVQAEEVHRDLQISFMTAAKGGEERVRISVDGQPRTIDVTIPRAIEDGAKLRIRNAGAPPGAVGPDLILTVKVGTHPLFRRGEGLQTGRGLDLFLDLPLTVAEATLGAEVAVPTLDGPVVELTVPPGTASGTRLRVRGRGLEDAKGRRGDLYCVVKVVPPDGRALDDQERAILAKLSTRVGNLRSGPNWPGG